ncbi:MAG: 2-dehydropantoate 2-reductase [Rhizobiaceae bacterium]|nr:2-dehydropantoate 2-reductase [Rhizobiaceae bacterium]
MLDAKTPITIAGAGSIGCYVGGCLALAGRKVTLLGRPRLLERVAEKGIAVVGLDGAERRVAPGVVDCFADPARALVRAGLVLVTVKGAQTAEMAELVAAFAPGDATVVSLQNGVDNPAILRSRLRPGQRSASGIVGFNVVQPPAGRAPPTVRRTTAGDVLVDAAIPGLAGLLDVDGLRTRGADDMTAVRWGKLILNLNNALNALSGLPLAQELADRRWRVLLASQVAEAVAALKAEGIEPASIGTLKPSLLPHVLRLPDFIFRILARQMLAIDPAARSSMLDDLDARRLTEVDQLQGAVVRLAEKHGRDAPVCRAVMALVAEAERRGEGSPRLSPDAIRP